MNKILVLIFSCKKYELRVKYLEKINYLNAFNESNIDYLIIVGNDTIDSEYILHDKTMTINVTDDYKSFPKKIIKTFSIIKELYNYDYIIKTDDDCILNLDNIEKIYNYMTNYDYIGNLSNYSTNYNPNYNGLHNTSVYIGPYMNGANGYIISKKALYDICNSPEITNKLLCTELYEDKLIGDILTLKKYHFKKHPIWSSKIINIMNITNYHDLITKHTSIINFNDIFNIKSKKIGMKLY